ncbi:MAG: cyclic pyranopterin monophosphate synthase MoaC [Myxococcota bacterium]
MVELPHLNERGEAHMVDVGAKADTKRVAVAEACLSVTSETLEALSEGRLAKGDALAVARIAGIQAAKKTADLIVLAHPLALTHVDVRVEPRADLRAVRVEVRVETTGPTGVEMEAMTAASVAALNVYDMVKKNDRAATLQSVRLIHKSGGVSGDFNR